MTKKQQVVCAYNALLSLRDEVARPAFTKALNRLIAAVAKEEKGQPTLIRQLKVVRQIGAAAYGNLPELIDYLTTPESRYIGAAIWLEFGLKAIDGDLAFTLKSVGAEVTYADVR